MFAISSLGSRLTRFPEGHKAAFSGLEGHGSQPDVSVNAVLCGASTAPAATLLSEHSVEWQMRRVQPSGALVTESLDTYINLLMEMKTVSPSVFIEPNAVGDLGGLSSSRSPRPVKRL